MRKLKTIEWSLIALILLWLWVRGLVSNPQWEVTQKVLNLVWIETNIEEVTIANPASVFCEDNGGVLEMVNDVNGAQSGICHLTGGEICEEWTYMRWECPVFVSDENLGGVVNNDWEKFININLWSWIKISDYMSIKTKFSYIYDLNQDGKVFLIDTYGWPTKEIIWADSISFQIFAIKEYDLNAYSKDKNNVYFFWEKIALAEPNTFQILNFRYAKDEKNAYFDLNKINWADVLTFSVLEWCDVSRDENNVYFEWNIIKWADTDTILCLSYDYFKDWANVWHRDALSSSLFKLIWADPITFEVLHGGWLYDAHDKNNKYLHWKIVK